MAVGYDFKKGADTPVWEWLAFFPAGPSYHGTSNVYDGKRYIYWVIQYSTTATTAGTTHLYRYDTFTDGWQFLAVVTSGNYGIDIEYDPVRNVLYIIHGATLTSWQVFNLNTAAVTIANVSCPAFTLTTMTPVLPLATGYGSSLTMPDDTTIAEPIDSATTGVGSTTTTLVATEATGTFASGMIGLEVRLTSGPDTGQLRVISSVTNKNTLVLSAALPTAPAAGVTFVIETPRGTSTGTNTTTTLNDTAGGWATNIYAFSDVIITGGTGSGQRRRIASNTATALTLAAAVTGNARTGPWTTTPDATSTYRIVPSSDFLYYQSASGLYRIDVAQTTGAAWTTLATTPAATGGGANTFHPQAYAPFQIMCVRGSASANMYSYNIGLNTWTTLTTFFASETFTTGAAAAAVHGRRKIAIQKEGSVRLYTVDLLTGILEPAGYMPYANPAAYDGKRGRFVKTVDGVEYIYILRAGGQEFYRVALEWLA